jgi:hypothetical protein
MLGYGKYQNFVADANKILIFTHNLTWQYPSIYIHELVVRARQLVLNVPQLVRALHRYT